VGQRIAADLARSIARPKQQGQLLFGLGVNVGEAEQATFSSRSLTGGFNGVPGADTAGLIGSIVLSDHRMLEASPTALPPNWYFPELGRQECRVDRVLDARAEYQAIKAGKESTLLHGLNDAEDDAVASAAAVPELWLVQHLEGKRAFRGALSQSLLYRRPDHS